MLNLMLEPPAQNRARALFDLIAIGLVIAVLTTIHYTNYHYEVDYHFLLQFAYYLLVIYAAMRFGPSGGIISSFVITKWIITFFCNSPIISW